MDGSSVVSQSAMTDRPAWQFRLSDLFALTTLCAVAAAIAAALGPGTLLLTGGLILGVINWRGAFTPLQHGRRQTYLLWLAWCLFLLSVVLPSIRIFGPVAGWGAAWLAMAAPLQARWSAEVEVESYLYIPWYEGINLANGLMLLMPVLIWRLRAGRGQWLSAVLCAAMIFPWSAGIDIAPLLIGYYVWSGAFFVALFALPLRWQTLATMFVLACSIGLLFARSEIAP